MGYETTVRLPARFLSVGQCVAREGWVHPERVLDSSVLIAVSVGIETIRQIEAQMVMRHHKGFLG